MKQLPHVAAALFAAPWAILPETHAELGQLYRNYVRGELKPFEGIPANLQPEGAVAHGISYTVDHASGVGVLHLSGVISKRAPEMFCGPPLVDLAKLDGLLDEVAQDRAIQTLIFDWNSPGGMVIGLQETAERIRELADSGLRTIAYTDFQCCSAAYYLAAACDEIYAAPSAVIGSIGTYCAGLDDSRAWEFEGLELILAKSGNLKAMGHPGKPWSDEERQLFQKRADDAGAEFRSWVTSRRDGVEDSTMQGQWFFAKDNLKGTVDGFYRDLSALLADLAPA